ncbi:hypothetical protein [Shewanella benthica]|uniref:Uncharacterized protein n=1 Tax=Shewanella benthica KT99 TaxID=314608 RepID=A9DJT3_9GAMM|nr:hypothetical protein [Shewanella benthica]EDP98967.1 hypothetical protein KT99_09503 [Shewanella benthica KT99]
MNKLLYLAFLLVLTTGLSLFTTGVEAKNDKSEKHQQHHKQGKPSTLPYGLQKKVAKGEPLPPEWQKKLHRGDILSNDLFSRGKIHFPMDKQGNITLDIDGSLIKFHDKTRKILDIITD